VTQNDNLPAVLAGVRHCNFFAAFATVFARVRSRPLSVCGNDLTWESAGAMRCHQAKSSLPGSSRCHWLISRQS